MWNCHVRGSELLLSTTNGSSSILYELTRLNELNSIVKLKSIHLQQQVTYFNLKNAKEKSSIDGHTLVVQCNGNLNRIQVQDTKLLCKCNKKSSILPKSLIGDVPFELVQHSVNTSPSGQQDQFSLNEDDLIVCDAIFSLEANCTLDYLQARLQYQNRILIFEVRCVQTPNAAGQQQNVTQNTPTTSSSPQHQKVDIKSRHLDHLFESNNQNTVMSTDATSGTVSPAEDCDIKPNIEWLKSFTDNTSSPTSDQQDKQQKFISSSSQPSGVPVGPLTQPTTVLRFRIRITNFGICIMPFTMTNYTCAHRFAW